MHLMRHGAPQTPGLLLTQLHPPLIIGIDAEDNPLDKHPVFIERDDLAQHERRQLVIGQHGRGPVPREHPMPRLTLQLGRLFRQRVAAALLLHRLRTAPDRNHAQLVFLHVN